jgi:hypothetical protein
MTDDKPTIVVSCQCSTSETKQYLFCQCDTTRQSQSSSHAHFVHQSQNSHASTINHNIKMKSLSCTTLLLLLTVYSSLSQTAAAARFLVNGPVVTVTLKDAPPQSSSEHSSSPRLPWLDLSALSPNAVWEISSTPACDVIVQPTHALDTGANSLELEALRGPHWISTKFVNYQKAHWFLNSLQGSFLLNLPYASLSSIRIQPTLCLGSQKNTVDIHSATSSTSTSSSSGIRIEAVTGVQGRTKAVLNYQYPHPTLSVLHQIDARNSIAPTIYLNTAKMMYQWNLSLRAGASLVTKVDPTR